MTERIPHTMQQNVTRMDLGRLADQLEALAEQQARIEAQQTRIEEMLTRLAVGKELDLLTTEDVRVILQVGRTKLAELIASGELPMWKLGGERRITRAGLEAYVRQKARAAQRAPDRPPRRRSRYAR